MNAYQPRTDDMFFVLSRVVDGPAQLQSLAAFEEVDGDLMAQVLREAGKFVGDVIAPLNRDGDEIGASCKDGAVTTPPGFRLAYPSWQRVYNVGFRVVCEDAGRDVAAAAAP